MFEKQKLELQVRSEPIQIQAFQTSIWDETLYAVRSLLKNNYIVLLTFRSGCRLGLRLFIA
jgi:hypothetical protein